MTIQFRVDRDNPVSARHQVQLAGARRAVSGGRIGIHRLGDQMNMVRIERQVRAADFAGEATGQACIHHRGRGDPLEIPTVATADVNPQELAILQGGDHARLDLDVVASTRAAFDDANRRIRAGSDGGLTIGTAVTFGLAVGLLVGGAARPPVAVALIPAGMMGLTLLDRSSRQPAAGRADATAGR